MSVVQKEGKVTTEDLEVDHIEELQDRPDLKLDPDNLRTLCKACHNKRHKDFNMVVTNLSRKNKSGKMKMVKSHPRLKPFNHFDQTGERRVGSTSQLL